MVDFATAGVAAGLSLAQRLIYRWITKGKVRIKSSEVDAEISRAARDEADRQRLRVDDLENTTRRLLEELIVILPQASFERGRLRGAELVLDYDPRDAKSSKELLCDLDAKVKLIADEVNLIDSQSVSIAAQVGANSSEVAADGVPFSFVEEGGEGPSIDAPSRSALMLEQLRKRVAERENPRE